MGIKMKVIYLDTNKWILLSRGWYSGKGEEYDLVLEIKEKIMRGKIRVVLSLSNVEETLKQSDKERRERLLDFMLDLSQGYTIAPYPAIKDIEIKNAFKKILSFPEMDLNAILFRRGLSGLFGKVPTILVGVPEETKKVMLEKVDSLETMRKILKSSDLRDEFCLSHIGDAEVTKKIEEARKNERKFPDKVLNNKLVMVEFILDFIVPHLIRFTLENNLSKEAILNPSDLGRVMKLFQSMPATYSFFCLNDMRNRNMDRKVNLHDQNDIFSFSVAIPYCDIVFGEKMIILLAKHSKLDKIYNKKITSSFKEFKQLIS